MHREGWVTFAVVATLWGIVLAANAYLLTDALAEGYEALSRADAPDPRWYLGLGGLPFLGAALLAIAAGGPVGHAWGKVRAGGQRKIRSTEKKDEAVEDDEVLQPPGFMGKALRTKRVGAAPLIGFSLLAFGLLVAGAALWYFGHATFVQTSGMNGQGIRAAVFWGQLLRFVAVPVTVLGALTMGIAWGRWFPLGEAEVIEGQREASRVASGYRFERHD